MKKCVLLGYLEGKKGCKLYRLDNESPKIVLARTRLQYGKCHVQRHLKILVQWLIKSYFHLCEEEAAYVQAFNEALLMEERFLKKKAKIEWLRVGDSNTTYFHKVVKGRKSQNRIDVVSNADGVRFDGVQEVKEDYFSMGDDKSPGPDGYTAALFKEAWPIISDDVTKVVQEFFVNGTLLKNLNHTIIALVPKVGSPTRINDYRHISCCNVIFKCISKIISDRMKKSLAYLVSPKQYAFISGRRISDNILLTHELMHNYHLDRGPPRCAFKVDIQKAYDTVDWVFLKDVLVGF
ncbi:hypothetical protein Tco_0699798 [Tanacetum coccineum]